jgi:antitoxin (DNA-binding transcriptional repressor) of toxin-antitoxin stability system
MPSVSITFAKANLEALCDRVTGGETITITRCGKPYAELRPLEQKPTASPASDR